MLLTSFLIDKLLLALCRHSHAADCTRWRSDELTYEHKTRSRTYFFAVFDKDLNYGNSSIPFTHFITVVWTHHSQFIVSYSGVDTNKSHGSLRLRFVILAI